MMPLSQADSLNSDFKLKAALSPAQASLPVTVTVTIKGDSDAWHRPGGDTQAETRSIAKDQNSLLPLGEIIMMMPASGTRAGGDTETRSIAKDQNSSESSLLPNPLLL